MGAFLEQISAPILISSLVGFLIFAWILTKFLWKPVLGVIDERRDSIEQAYREVDAARAEVAQMRADYEAQMAQISATAQAKLQEQMARGEQLAAEIRQSAEEQREKLLARTQEDIEREKQKALAELRSEAVELSFTIAERVLKEGIDKQTHDKLVAQFVDDLKRLG